MTTEVTETGSPVSDAVRRALEAQPVVDMHTHLYPPALRHAGAQRARAEPTRRG